MGLTEVDERDKQSRFQVVSAISIEEVKNQRENTLF